MHSNMNVNNYITLRSTYIPGDVTSLENG